MTIENDIQKFVDGVVSSVDGFHAKWSLLSGQRFKLSVRHEHHYYEREMDISLIYRHTPQIISSIIWRQLRAIKENMPCPPCEYKLKEEHPLYNKRVSDLPEQLVKDVKEVMEVEYKYRIMPGNWKPALEDVGYSNKKFVAEEYQCTICDRRMYKWRGKEYF